MAARTHGLKVIASAIVGNLLMISTVAIAADESYPSAQMLVDAQQLAKHELPASTIVLDIRDKAKYDAGHVKEARWVAAPELTKEFTENQDEASWSKRIGDLGISSDSTVVLYGDQSVAQTCRIWFILRHWGVEDVRLLNGGWKAWEEGRFEVDQSTPASTAVTFKAQGRTKRLASKQDVLESLARRDRLIVDARSTGEFCGDDKRSNKRGGAIPGAKHLDWVDLIDNSSQRFKSASELKGLFAAAGIDPATPVTTYCQSGGRASVMMFALELMGADDVANYYRSWSEWGNADDTPIEPGKAQ